jgi:hypothetical protein
MMDGEIATSKGASMKAGTRMCLLQGGAERAGVQADVPAGLKTWV